MPGDPWSAPAVLIRPVIPRRGRGICPDSLAPVRCPSRKILQKGRKIEFYLLTRAKTLCIMVTYQLKGVITMKASEIIRAIMKDKKMSMAALGRMIGTEGVAANAATDMISKRLNQKTISVDRVVEMVDKMDYKVVIVPKGVTVRSDWYEVDGDDNE